VRGSGEEQVLAPLGADDADVPQARSLAQQLRAQRGRRAAAQRADEHREPRAPQCAPRARARRRAQRRLRLLVRGCKGM